MSDVPLMFREIMEAPKRVLYIMRGIPGSGKSWEANRLAGESGVVFSTDNLISPDPDEYRRIYSAGQKDGTIGNKLHAWHRRNYEMTEEALQQGISPVVVDNTNLKKRDIRPYVVLARKYGYEPQIKEPTSKWWGEIRPWLSQKNNDRALDRAAARLAYRNTHGVPETVIKKMLENWYEVSIDEF